MVVTLFPKPSYSLFHLTFTIAPQVRYKRYGYPCFTDGEKKLREENLPSRQPGSYVKDLLGRLLLHSNSLKHHNPAPSLQSMAEG